MKSVTIDLNDHKEALAKNSKKVHDCIDEFFSERSKLSETIEMLGFLLTTFVNDKENDWYKDFLSKTVSDVSELNAFIAKLNDLHNQRNETIFFPKDDVVLNG